MPPIAKPVASINFNASVSRRLQHKEERPLQRCRSSKKPAFARKNCKPGKTRTTCPDDFGAFGSAPSLCLFPFALAISRQLRLILFQIFFHRGSRLQANRNSLLTQISQVAVMAKSLAQLNDLDMKLTHFPQLPDLQNRLCLCFLIRLHKSLFSSKPPRFVNFNREKKKARPQKETRPSVCLIPKILDYRAKTALSWVAPSRSSVRQSFPNP